MPVEVVLDLNNALKKVDYYKKTSTTTLDNRSIGKPVTTTDKNIDDFKELFNNRIFTPSVTLINDTAKTVFTQSITTFILKLLNMNQSIHQLSYGLHSFHILVFNFTSQKLISLKLTFSIPNYIVLNNI